MMKRNKIILIVVLAVALLACGVVGWLLIKSIMSKSEAEEQRNRDYSSLKKIYSSQVFPSPENIDRVKADQKELEDWLVSISEQLHKGDLPEVSLTPATFKQKLQGTVRELSKHPGIKNGKVVEAQFNFGFDQYLGESNQLPDPNNVPRLALQLNMIEEISKELFDAKILSLDVVGREIFDSVDKAASEAEQIDLANRRRRPPPKNKNREPVQQKKEVKQIEIPEGLVTKEKFTFEFTATPEAYIAALNKLSSMNLFVVIKESSFVKNGDQLKKLETIMTAAPDENKQKKISEMNHYERTVTDPVSDPPVSVKLVLEVYSFKGV